MSAVLVYCKWTLNQDDDDDDDDDVITIGRRLLKLVYTVDADATL